MNNIPFPRDYWRDPNWRKQLSKEPATKNPNPGGWQRVLKPAEPNGPR